MNVGNLQVCLALYQLFHRMLHFGLILTVLRAFALEMERIALKSLVQGLC